MVIVMDILILSIVRNLGEVYYITLREQGQNVAELAYARIKAFPLRYTSLMKSCCDWGYWLDSYADEV
jgi:hypothetical protein